MIKQLTGVMTAGIFLVSLLPIPVPITGTCSHPGGTPLGAILLGPWITALISTVGGILFMRVFDKSFRLWQAMLCRGYNGKIQVSYERKLTRGDLVVAVFGVVLIIGSWTFILS